MKVKKVLSVLLALVLILGISPTIAAAETPNAVTAEMPNNLVAELPKITSPETPQFSDMPGDWSKAAMEKAVSSGLLTGSDGKIMPQENLTRAQLATILNRAFGSSQKASLAAFADVREGAWYYDEMAKAVSMGTFQGNGNKLSPESVVTRQEVFTVLARAFRLPSGGSSALSKFSDASSVSSWAQSSVSALAAAGYINGTNGRLNPAANITRAEFAQIMDNMIKSYLTNSQTIAKVPDGNVMVNAPEVTLKGVTINGDLIIGEGVGDGNATLDSVKVTGRILVRGGGVNSIKIIGTSEADLVILARSNGKVRVTVSNESKIQVIEIDDGSDDIFVEGTVSSISVMAEGITVTANNARIGTALISGQGSKIIVGESASIGKLQLDAERTEAQVAGAVDSIEATKKAAGAVITGTGRVSTVQANANNVKVETPNTTVTAGPGVKGVTSNGKPVSSDGTASTPGTSSGSGGGGGGGNNGGGDSSGIMISDLNVSANKNSNVVKITANVTNAASDATAVISLTGTGKARDFSKSSPASYDAIPVDTDGGDSGDVNVDTYSGIPIAQGKINATIYGSIANDTYTVTVTVGTTAASASGILVDAGISLRTKSEYGALGYPLDYFGAGKPGISLIASDDESLDADRYSDYTYDVIAINLTKGTSSSLLSSQTFTQSTFTDFQQERIILPCNSPDFFDSAGAYAIVMIVSLNGKLAGESGYSFSILPSAPDVSLDYTNESITGYNSSTMEYEWDENFHAPIWSTARDLSAANSLSDAIPYDYPSYLFIRMKSPQSAAASVDIPVRRLAPSGLSASDATSASSSDGSISGLDAEAGYQYKLYTAASGSEAGAWSDVPASTTEISGLAPGTYYVRLKATNQDFASKPTSLNIFDASAPAPEAPAITDVTVIESEPTKLLLKFSKAMSENGIDLNDFTVKSKSRNLWYGSDSSSIVSAELSVNDPSVMELTMANALKADFTYSVTYVPGTAASADGVVLPSFKNQPVVNLLIYDDLSITLNSNASDIDYFNFGQVDVSKLALSDGGSFNTSYTYGYQICGDNSTSAPVPGTTIDALAGVTTGDYALYQISQRIVAVPGDYLVMYVYDENDNDVIYGFGQVQIQSENIGKGWNSINLSSWSEDMLWECDASINQLQKLIIVTLSDTQEVTEIGGDDASLVSAETSDPENLIYTVDTTSLVGVGGKISFTITVQDSSTSNSFVLTVRVKAEPPTAVTP